MDERILIERSNCNNRGGKKPYRLLILLGVFCLVFISCKKVTPLEYALGLAGENRPELEKVLEHYAGDSLKYEAARFLIENMPYHYYYTGEELDYKRQYYKLLTETSNWGGVVADSLDREVPSKNFKETLFKCDIEEVEFDYLVSNIEWAFKVREEQPWGKNVSFEDFCEYILPYRIGDEDIAYWREDVYSRYNPLLDSIRGLPEAEDPLFVSQVLFDSLRKVPIYFCNHAYYGHRVGPKLSEWLSGDCLEITDAGTYIFRALGLPSSCESMLIRGDSNVPHHWNFTIDKEGNPYYFSLAYSDTEMIPTKKYPHPKGKVYRESFSLNTDLAKMQMERTDIHSRFRYPKMKDVTGEYTPIELSVDFPIEQLCEDIKKGEVIYLCQSSRQQWYPVGITSYEKKRLLFQNIEANIVYTLAVYENNILSVISDPFYMNKDSILHLYSPKKNTIDIALYHKYRLDFGFRNKLEKGVFEASNTRDFRQKDTLFMITSRPNRLNSIVTLNTDKQYQYVRYYGPENGYCNIAEVAFWDDKGSLLTGKVIGTSNREDKRATHEYTNVFDGDPNTSFDYYLPTGGWAGLDLGQPKSIGKLSYTPRNRDNYIRVGNTYELFYFQDWSWQSAGICVADSDSIIFNVPENTLLYLKNHTGGSDERIFGIENGNQRFW
jgi:hypothetical protein